MGVEPTRVAVFIDWQNVLRAAWRAFGMQGLPVWHANFSPFRVAGLLAAANHRGSNGRLVGVGVFRGLPSPKRDPIGYAANRRQAAVWKAEAPEIVTVRMRSLRYPRNFPAKPPVEKGVDVELALAAVEAVVRDECDVAVVFSHDTDLLPVPATLIRLAGPQSVETAAWVSPTFHQQLGPSGPVHHHALSERIFKHVSTPVNYAYRG